MRKSRATAITSFAFSLFFWIPLINLICGAFAIYFGIKSLIKIREEPSKYYGKGFAIAGLVLGMLVYLTYLTGLGICLLGFKEVCANIGLAYLA